MRAIYILKPRACSDPKHSRYCWSDDLTISRQHIRIHCILYEQDPVSDIAPFVYATDLSANGTYLRKSNNESSNSQEDGILIGRDESFLLDHGDELHLSETVKLIFQSIKPITKIAFSTTQEKEKAIFAHQYHITGRLLGEGGYGKVLIGVDEVTHRQLACKIVRLDHLYDKAPPPKLRLPTGPREEKAATRRKRWPTRVAACFREFDILKDLNHPNIVAIEKVFWSHKTIYIFQELVTGGDLFSFLEFKGGRLDHAQAAVVIHQVLTGVAYLHQQGIVHRDLKPDNILMTSLQDGARIIITDFGNARFLPKSNAVDNRETTKYQRMFSYVGTLEFAAPEIYKMNPNVSRDHGYSKSVDMWSIGSITVTILSGEAIFTDRTHPEYYENPRHVIMGLAAKCDLSVLDDEYHPTWSNVDECPKDFIKRLLVLSENDRMTAVEALSHNWMMNGIYVEELEKIYKQSINAWKPREADSQLVERISKKVPDLTVVGLPGRAFSQENISHFFHPSEQDLAQNIIKTLSASQDWRPNTPLPPITNRNDLGQFASQVEPHSWDDARVEGHLKSPKSTAGNRCAQSQDLNISQSLDQQQSRTGLTAQGISAAFSDHGQADSDTSTESLNNVAPVAFSQRSRDLPTQPSQSQYAQHVVLVQDTPLAEQRLQSAFPSYQQTQWSEEAHQIQDGVEGESLDFVRETPQESVEDQLCWMGNDLSSYH